MHYECCLSLMGLLSNNRLLLAGGFNYLPAFFICLLENPAEFWM
jgi:hypothetical protein